MRKKKKDDRLLSSHDLPFKAFFSENEVAKSFLEENLPKSLIDRLDFNTLKIAKDSFVDKKLSQYFSDLLYEVKLQGKPALVYLLFDHKSKEDKFTGFQLLKYMVRIWESYFKQNKKVRYLPVIIPMVVYHGEKKWRIDSRFNSLFEETEHMEEYIPNFRYDVYDVSHIPDEDIQGACVVENMFDGIKIYNEPRAARQVEGYICTVR
jgi:predicted transposase/invertase (TIGR01784 family)